MVTRTLTGSFRNQFPDFRNEIVRNIHDRVRALNTSFVLQEGVHFGLLFVMGEYPPHFLFIPSRRKFVLTHFCFFLPRARNAASGFPAISYAVITNTLSDCGAGTYTTRRYRPEAVWPNAILEPSRPGRSSPGFSKTSTTSTSSTWWL